MQHGLEAAANSIRPLSFPFNCPQVQFGCGEGSHGNAKRSREASKPGEAGEGDANACQCLLMPLVYFGFHFAWTLRVELLRLLQRRQLRTRRA